MWADSIHESKIAMKTLGQIMGDIWIDMLFNKNSHSETRRQVLYNSFLADLPEDRFFSPFEGEYLRVGERRWRAKWDTTLRQSRS